MKGLLLKDWYMVKKYCRSYIVISAALIALSLGINNNSLILFYPCLLCGMIPVNLLSYDERSQWLQYCGTLPYTKKQIVSAKYLIGFFAQLAMLTLSGITQLIKMTLKGNFVFGEYAMFMLMMLTMATLSSSITLPFVFKLGVEKGRITYYVTIGVVCAVSLFASGAIGAEKQADFHTNSLFAALAPVGICVYILSWYLSVVFYNKREIQ